MTLDTTADDFLTEAQTDLETLSVAMGRTLAVERFQEAMDQGEGFTTRPIKETLQQALPAAVEAFRAIIADPIRGTRGDARELLQGLDPKVVILSGLSRLLDAALNEYAGLPSVIDKVARDIEIEVWAAGLLKANPKLYRRITERQMTAQSARKRRLKGAKGIAAKEGYEPDPWSADLKAAVAEPVIDACLGTGLFVVEGEMREGRVIRLTEEAAVSLASAQDRMLEWARPVFMPMVTQPARWSSLQEGGYLSEVMRKKTRMVSSFDRGRNKLIEGSLSRGHMAPVQDALATLSCAPLRVDPGILTAVEKAKEMGWRANKLPINSIEPYAYPEDYDDLSAEAQKGHRLRALETRKLAQSVLTENVVYARTMDTARMMEPYGAFYLPHNLDFRGRCYPIPSYSHHRADWVRAQFRFANPYPLGDHGQRWLAIHLANNASGSLHGKLDKASFDDRVAWVHQNPQLIERVANDWADATHLWIDGVDYPFQFLAACREWVEAGSTGMSALPIGLDGTNSGCQHYAAALRSSYEGSLVNLTTSDKPQDVYGVVAQAVLEQIQLDVGGEQDELAQRWLAYGVTRSTVKRQVMTFAYSSETFGFAQQIRDDLMRPLFTKVLLGELAEHPFGEDRGYAAALYMARKIWDVIQVILPGAASGLAWLKDIAGLLAAHGHPMVWYPPSGMPVLHRYQDWDKERVTLYLSSGKLALPDSTVRSDPEHGRDGHARVEATLRTKPNGKLVASKQRSASAPNVIHSMDAAHLMLTANAASRQGVNDLLMIHDSFATTAGQTETLARVLRETFVDMYSNYCPFEEIARQARKALPPTVEVPALPVKGDLDLSEVLRSPYFFG